MQGYTHSKESVQKLQLLNKIPYFFTPQTCSESLTMQISPEGLLHLNRHWRVESLHHVTRCFLQYLFCFL